MKKFLLFTFFILTFNSTNVAAIPILISYDGEEVVNVVDLPDTDEFQVESGENIDIGYLYKSVTILFIPVWNYDGRLVATTSEKGSYYDVPEGLIKKILLVANEPYPEGPYLDFWHLFGGKLLFIAIILFFGIRAWRKNKARVSYLSSLATPLDRLADIIVTADNFLPADLNHPEAEITEDLKGLAFFGVKSYMMSFLTVSIFDMNKVSIDDVESAMDDYFARLVNIRKTSAPRTKTSINSVYFLFEETPTSEEVKRLMALKKRQIKGTIMLIPGIIDVENKTINTKRTVYPAQKILKNCFIKADPECDRVPTDK